MHRLDRDTTGALIFATTTDSAQLAYDAFISARVKKTYLFITDRKLPSQPHPLKVESHIRKEGKNWVSRKELPANAITQFTILKTAGDYSLWQASPVSGKTHQIRLHAADIGIPILGDTLYGGSPFVQIMLHSKRIEVADLLTHDSPPPHLYEHLSLCQNQLLARWLCQLDRRTRLFPSQMASTEQSLRLIDDKENGYCCDKFGDVLWFYRFLETPLNNDERSAIASLQKLCNAKSFVLRQMENRGKSSHLKDEQPSLNWIAKENNFTFNVSTDRGWSPGLFLDQRANRQWVLANSQQAAVLNLFCYSGLFSVAAFLGGAREIVSVDTSKVALDWCKENFLLNNLDPAKGEFWQADTRDFLKGCLRRKRQFDLIICDPPSFARNKNGVFRLENEFETLIAQMVHCLAKQGRILLSCNLETWDDDRLYENLNLWTRKLAKEITVRIEKTPTIEWDFIAGASGMKSFFITRAT